MPLIEEVLNDVAWEHQSLEAIAVTGGPGSFTGLRIGVATAKGLCQGWNLPLIALDSTSESSGCPRKALGSHPSAPRLA